MSVKWQWVLMAASVLAVIAGIVVIEFNGGVANRAIYIPFAFMLFINIIALSVTTKPRKNRDKSNDA